jgi:NADPH-dependent 2,4-dienoyl-CoA reductase/sulfur reductase-like enzyme
MVKRRDFLRDSLLLAAGTTCSSALLAETSSAGLPKQETISLKREVPVRYNADVVVIGGGISGVSAACSAALSGVRVILVERFGMLGGSLTTGGVANFCGQIEAQGEVFDEILRDLRKFNSLGEGTKASVFNYEILAYVLQEMVLRRNIKVLYHTRLVDVMVKGNTVTECVICGKSGLEAIKGKLFIDCSGDADLARYAGLTTIKGDEKTGYQLPMSKISLGWNSNIIRSI